MKLIIITPISNMVIITAHHDNYKDETNNNSLQKWQKIELTTFYHNYEDNRPNDYLLLLWQIWNW